MLGGNGDVYAFMRYYVIKSNFFTFKKRLMTLKELHNLVSGEESERLEIMIVEGETK